MKQNLLHENLHSPISNEADSASSKLALSDFNEADSDSSKSKSASVDEADSASPEYESASFAVTVCALNHHNNKSLPNTYTLLTT